MVAMADMENENALRRLQKSLDKIGINNKLKTLGAKDGDTVRIRDIEFEYEDDNKVVEDLHDMPRRGRGARAGK